MGVERTGDWKKVKKMLQSSRFDKVSKALQQATHKAAVLLVKEIKKGVIAQAPGGKAFTPLAESTVDKKGSSKALIDTGFLVNSITQLLQGDQAFIGLLKTAVNDEGENMANIGAVMEYGATIKHPNGAVIVIPARPFLGPVYEAFEEEIIDCYKDALGTFLK